MGKYRMTAGKDDRPVFTSNGIRVLHASGCDTQISLLDPKVLKDKFGAELLLDNVKLNPYWQIGECVGGIYRLENFPLDGSDYDFKGLLIFNTVPSEEYKKACKDPGLIAPVGAICDMIIGSYLFGSFGHDENGHWGEISKDPEAAVSEANKLLQTVIDKYNTGN